MDKQLPFTTAKGSFLAVEVPDTHRPIVVDNICHFGVPYLVCEEIEKGKPSLSWLELPSNHNYELIGVTGSMTEEQAASVVDDIVVFKDRIWFKDYEKQGEITRKDGTVSEVVGYNNSLVSINSLLRSIGADTNKQWAIIKID